MSIPSRSFSYNSTMDRSNASDMMMDSDDEITSVAGSHEQSSDVNRWLGERYFNLLLSKEVAKMQTNRPPGIGLDAQMADAQKCYPYTDHLQFLEDQSESTWSHEVNNRDLDDREILLISIGDIMLHGSKEDRKTLAQSLYKFAREQILRGATSNSRPSQEFWSFGNNGNLETTPEINVVSRTSYAHFAVALKEKGDEIGICPVYDTRSIHDYPPKFETTIKFCGKIFRGYGPSKKQSRHDAAKITCTDMNINAGPNYF